MFQPTNHLDGVTVNALCDALSTYEGAVIAVSHDEDFINRVVMVKKPNER